MSHLAPIDDPSDDDDDDDGDIAGGGSAGSGDEEEQGPEPAPPRGRHHDIEMADGQPVKYTVQERRALDAAGSERWFCDTCGEKDEGCLAMWRAPARTRSGRLTIACLCAGCCDRFASIGWHFVDC